MSRARRAKTCERLLALDRRDLVWINVTANPTAEWVARQIRLIGWTVVDLIRSRAALEAEIWTLRQQINVLRRTAPKKLSFSAIDRLVFVGLYRLFPKVCDALAIVKPDTIVRWHRAGFRLYWRWKSRRRGGRPRMPLKICRLIREYRQSPMGRTPDSR